MNKVSKPKRITIANLEKGHLYSDPMGNLYEHRSSHSDCALFRNCYKNSNDEIQLGDTFIILNDKYILHLKEVK